VAKRGRPKKSPDEKAVSVTIPQWAADMLDAAIRDPIKLRILAEVEDSDLDLPKLRREAIANLIQGKFSFEAQNPDRIKIIAPCAGNAGHFKEASDWLGEQEKRLEAEAPLGIRQAIEVNRGFLNAVGKNAIRRFEIEQKEDDKP